MVPAEGRFSENWAPLILVMSQTSNAQNPRARIENASDLAGPTKFFGGCYDVSHQKKTCGDTIPSFGGGQILCQVASVASKIREFVLSLEGFWIG